MNPTTPDTQVWVALPQDELDALELGWRTTNALIEENDPDPSINWPIWVELAYQEQEGAQHG